jgi:hypothetical protein
MKRLIIFIPIVLVLLIGISTANAQRSNDPASPQSGYSLDWYTIDGSGGSSSGGGYSLGGTLGQPDAGLLGGGSYTLNGGFWGGVIVPVQNNYDLFLPLVLR